MRLTMTRFLAVLLPALIVALPAAAQDKLAPYGPPWFRDTTIGKNLGLTAQQIDRLNQTYDRMNARWREDITDVDRLPERDRVERLRALSQTFRTDMSRGLSESLDEKQRARFRQLELQSRGWAAFTDPALQKTLRLTDDQARLIDGVADKADRATRDLTELAKTNRDDAIRRYNELRTATRDAVNSILNDEQRKAWTNFLGEPHDFPSPFERTDR